MPVFHHLATSHIQYSVSHESTSIMLFTDSKVYIAKCTHRKHSTINPGIQ